MDSTISKMLKIMAAIFAAGCLADGYIGSEADKFDYVMGFCLIGGGVATLLTIIWAVTAYNIKDILKGKERKDVSGNLIGTAISIPAILVSLMTVGCSIIAALHGKFDYSVGLCLIGGAAQCVITLIWCITDYNFCDRSVRDSRYS